MTTEPKRCWERKDGVLIDRWVGADGIAGETRSIDPVADEADRQRRLDRIAKGSPGATMAMSDAESPDHLDALLAGIDAGSTPDITLLRYADDPRVRPVVVRSVEALGVDDAGLGNALQVLGYLGGEGALSALRDKANALAALAETWVDDDFHNRYAGLLEGACKAILRLDPEAVDAASLVVRLCEHPCGSNRQHAFAAAGEWLRLGAPRTAATQMLRRTLLDTAATDDDAFIAAAPALRWSADDFEDRAIAILEDQGSRRERDEVVGAFRLLTLPLPGRLARALRRTVDEAADVRDAVHLCGMLGALVPDATLVDLATRALASSSPSLRTDGCWVLSDLSSDDARRIAEAALVDEPDPVLVAKLRSFTSAPVD